ncbi:MAG: hypothetical protein ACRDHM_09165 [Actinomycetota bacterium]
MNRPPVVLVAGILLIAGGAVASFAAVRYFDQIGPVNGVLQVAVGLGAIYGGVQVLALRELGRMIGLGLCGVGAAFAVLALLRGYTPALVSLALNGFVIFALVTTAESFRRA